MNKFFIIRKCNKMDEYLMDMKEATDLLEEVGLLLHELIVCYYTWLSSCRAIRVVHPFVQDSWTSISSIRLAIGLREGKLGVTHAHMVDMSHSQ